MEGVTTAILIDKRRAKKDGTYPVKLRVTFQGEQRYYKNKYSYTEEMFNSIMGEKTKKGYKEVKLKLNQLEQRAFAIINEMEDFSFSLFEKQFSVKPSDRSNIFYAFDQKIKELYDEGRIKTAKGYESSLASLKAYLNKDKLRTGKKGVNEQDKEILEFKAIDQNFLKSYEQWMLRSGKSLNSVAFISGM